MMNILITGANGFLGSHIVDRALETGQRVLAGVRKNSNRRYLEGKDVHYLFTDLNKLDEVEHSLSAFRASGGSIDCLVHNAGVTKADSPEAFMRGNAELSDQFFQLILKVFPDLKKIIFISSMAAGGPGSSDMIPLRYGYPEHPMTPYGQSKRAAEEKLRSLSDAVDHIIFRPTAIYGPRESKMLPMIKALKKGLEVDFSDKRQRLSFIHAEDLSRLVIKASTSEIRNKTYLVSDGEDYAMKDYRQYVKDYLKLKTLNMSISPQTLHRIVVLLNKLSRLSGRSMHLTPEKVKDITALNWKVDIEALRRDFDFEPQFNLEKGLHHTLDWYLREGWI